MEQNEGCKNRLLRISSRAEEPTKKAECAALDELYCINEECRFYKRKKREKQEK